MRIVVLTNLYPPYYVGGYEIRCQDVVEQLRARGHHVVVLTSQYGCQENEQDVACSTEAREEAGHVFRVLSFGVRVTFDLWSLYQAELSDHTQTRRVIKYVCPDLFYIWNCRGLSNSLLLHLQSYRIPMVYHFEDDWFLYEFKYDPWLTYCQHEHPFNILRSAIRIHQRQNTDSPSTSPAIDSHESDMRHQCPKNSPLTNSRTLVKKIAHMYHHGLRYVPKSIILNILGPCMTRYLPLQAGTLDVRSACFISHFRQQEYLEAGVPVKEAVVIHGGIDTRRFITSPLNESEHLGAKILCAARLCQEKGIHTILEAVDLLMRHHVTNITLTICGQETGGKTYTALLREKIAASSALQHAVNFLGHIPYENMPEMYLSHDIFISASIIPEGFPLTLVEAMASGLIVFSSGTGGAKEIIRHQENGVLFPAGNADALANELRQMLSHPEWRRRLSQNARQTACAQFDIHPMVTKIEAYLQAVCS